MSGCSTDSSFNDDVGIPMENIYQEQQLQQNDNSSADDSTENKDAESFEEEEEGEEKSLNDLPPNTNEYEEVEDLINLDNNDDLNYYEDEEHLENTESDSRLPHSPQQMYDLDEKLSNDCNSPKEDEITRESSANFLVSKENDDDLQEINEKNLEEIQGEEISSEDETENQDVGEEGELTDEVPDRENEIASKQVEQEDLEDGEIRSDSDDGIPEIKGGLSPQTLPAHSSTIHQLPNISTAGGLGTLTSTFPTQSQQQVNRYKHTEGEREVCRFFLRGNCKNGENCRFRHTRDARARIQQLPSFTVNLSSKPSNYYIRIPPPMGPPIPLLSRKIAPPCPLPPAVIRPSLPVNMDSAVWEQGLKKAREMVRRQKGDQFLDKNELLNNTEVTNDNAISDEQKLEPVSPPLVEDLGVLDSNEKYETSTSRHQSNLPSFTQNRIPIASRRVIVEEISVVTSASPLISEPKLASRIVKPSNNKQNKTKANIPSLIDNIVERPIMKHSHKHSEERHSSHSKEKRDDRKELKNSNSYTDPWVRQNSFSSSATGRGDTRDKDRRHTDSHKRRRSNEINLPVTKRKRSFSFSSSSVSTVVSQKGTLGALLTTSTPKMVERKIKTKQQAGPKTPPEEEECRASQGSSVSSRISRRKKFDTNRNHRTRVQSPLRREHKRETSFQLEHKNQRPKNFNDNERRNAAQRFFDEDNDDAPAAYRLPRQMSNSQKIGANNKKRKVMDRSSSSGSTTSTSSGSSSSFSTKERKQIKKNTLKDKISAAKQCEDNQNPITATICSSQRAPKTPPPLPNEENMDSISSSDSDDEVQQQVKIEKEINKEKQQNVPYENVKKQAHQKPEAIINTTSDLGQEQTVTSVEPEKFVASFMEVVNQKSPTTILECNDQIKESHGVNEFIGGAFSGPSKDEHSSSNSKDKSQKNKKRESREELLRKLQSIEEAIARKKRSKEAAIAPVEKVKQSN